MFQFRTFALLWCVFIACRAAAGAAEDGQESPPPQDWDYAEAMKAVAAKGAGRPGVVLHVGDSITYASPYGAWARAGEGRTDADKAALRWMHAGADDDTDGWYLARFDHPDGGRSHTACSGLRADELLAGGKRGMPKLTDLLDQYKPQAVVVMLGTNDASARRPVEAYRRDVETILVAMLSRGVVPVLSTIPPHVHQLDLAASYNDALRELSRRLKLPLIDFEREVLARRPSDWDGTLMGRGDVHPTAEQGGATPISPPSAESLRNSGYLLRGWLSVRKLVEVKEAVFDAPATSAAAQAPREGAGPPARPWFPKAPPLPKPAGQVIRVRTVDELFRAADEVRPGGTILVADGHYAMSRSFELRTDDVTLRSESGDRDAVVLDAADSRFGEVVGVGGCSGVTVADLTIRNARTNAVKINADRGATKVTLRNCVLHNAWQRGVKGVAVRPEDRERFRPSDCRVEYCLFYNDRPKRFEDDADDTAENYGGNYVGGIDAMYARRWTISDNVFVGIRGRTGEARGAVFLWLESADCVVERNVIIDCDSGVCLGNGSKPDDVEAHARRCVVRNNFVTRCPEQGVAAVHTRDCRIVHNTVFDPAGRYGRLVRVLGDNDGLLVANNLVSDARGLEAAAAGGGLGAGARVRGNAGGDLSDLCVDAESGDLHLRGGTGGGEHAAVTDAAEAADGAGDDFDGQRRGAKPDAGADELPEVESRPPGPRRE
jgi:hypothetical protein